MVIAGDGEGVMDVDNRVVEAERQEDELEAEVARLEREAERLHRAYIAGQQAFEQRRDELMEAKRTARLLERGDA